MSFGMANEHEDREDDVDEERRWERRQIEHFCGKGISRVEFIEISAKSKCR